MRNRLRKIFSQAFTVFVVSVAMAGVLTFLGYVTRTFFPELLASAFMLLAAFGAGSFLTCWIFKAALTSIDILERTKGETAAASKEISV